MEPGSAITGSRRLLRRLRDVMAGSGTAQDRLNTIVRLIAADMVAEVCSAYLLRAGEVLELFATEGLRPEAVHRTRLRVGEGLVGVIAATGRPLALADAQSHPDFAYRPETGEEIYHSLMGVPILRADKVLGVLVVQNRTQRHYDEDETETLQTVAMVLAELAASGELVSPEELAPGDGIGLLPVRLEGIRLNTGLALGTAVIHAPRIMVKHVVAEDPQAETERLREAVKSMQSAIDAMLAESDVARGGEHRDILETYRMFAADRGWIQRIRAAVQSGLTAEAAVQKVQDDTRVRMSQISDPYLRERLMDLEDLTNRLLQHLTGKAGASALAELPEEFVLVARTLGPAELLDYDRRRLRAVVMEEGSPTAHVAIVGRALDIPMVGRVKGVLHRVEAGALLVVNGDEAQVLVRPGEDVLQAVEHSLQARQGARARYQKLRDLPAVTRDGVAVELHLNAGLTLDLPYLDETGAAGIGLFRTELPFMIRNAFPNVAAQSELYSRILEQAGERPVVFRTLDIGGDKLLPYLPEFEDENPAMGWRAIRIALDRPAMLRQQLRALLRAAAGRRLRVMFPMVAEVAEFEAACAILEKEVGRATSRGEAMPFEVKCGVMVEVPALLWQLPALLERVDFLSIGTNDLAQFLFASDRGNPRLTDRYDTLAPAFLRVLGEVARQAGEKQIPVSVCGEMAGNALDAMALVGLGFRLLSMNPGGVGPVKAMVRSLALPPLQELLRRHLDAPDHSLRAKLRAFARDHDVNV
ncbi:MAG TPA: phosphoenolpyruvate--protein phosphotransferase [Stellaceae bacterium]|nr:phosphoenolpyruvate--protein phosphotransferase [Stellaceae bacterium]